MFWNQLFIALGAMTFAYALSEVSLTAAKKLEQSGKLRFILHFLLLIHYFSSISSLFVGLFMYYQKEDIDRLQKTVQEVNSLQQNSKEKMDTLTLENEQLQEQLRHEVLRTEKRSYESGRKHGYVNGYSIGFEDCMDVLNLEQERKSALMPMARQSGIHRIKTRPTFLDTQKAVEVNGILQ